MTLAMLETLDIAHGPGTGVIWLNRPDNGNTLNAQAIAELHHAFTDLIADPDVRVVVLAGRGDAFCSGFDLDWLAGAQASELDPAAQLLAAIRNADKPVIVRAHGVCAGIGMALAAAATLTVAARDARFSHPGARLGVTPVLSAPLIAAAIGERAARRWLLTGEPLDAAEAWRIGLAHELCEADALDARINQILGHLIHAAPGAARETLALLRVADACNPPPAEQARNLAAYLQRPDAQAGLTAHQQAQSPPWVQDLLRNLPEI